MHSFVLYEETHLVLVLGVEQQIAVGGPVGQRRLVAHGAHHVRAEREARAARVAARVSRLGLQELCQSQQALLRCRLRAGRRATARGLRPAILLRLGRRLRGGHFVVGGVLKPVLQQGDQGLEQGRVARVHER